MAKGLISDIGVEVWANEGLTGPQGDKATQASIQGSPQPSRAPASPTGNHASIVWVTETPPPATTKKHTISARLFLPAQLHTFVRH